MITLERIKKEFESTFKMSLTPDESKFGKRLSNGHIIDEEKSVRWNREEVERRNEAIKEEKKRLLSEYDAEIMRVTDEFIKWIEVTYNLNEKEARIIYSRAYDEHHSYWDDIYDAVDEYCEIYSKLLDARKEN